jgi:oligopeptide transport system permease protein
MSSYKENYFDSIKYESNSKNIREEIEIPDLVAKDFKSVDIYKNDNSDQISGKPTRYVVDVARRFFRSKPATFFLAFLGVIIVCTIIIPLLN